MRHQMKLQPEFYENIKNKSKKIELRLNDEKRRKIKIGDEIEFFKEPDLKESIIVKVIGLLNYQSFSDIINDFDPCIFADESYTRGALLEECRRFYSEEEEKNNGVLGIRIELEV